MSESSAAGRRPTGRAAAAEDATIRPFQVSVPAEELAELRRRIAATRWPEKETVADPSQGVQLATRMSFFYTKGIGYALEMGLRSQTLYGLADSPVALAAWMLDHDAWSYEDIAAAFVDGQPVCAPHPERGERVPQGALSGAAELGRAGLPNLIYFNEVDKGNHFAAWQEPELLTSEVRAAFRSLR